VINREPVAASRIERRRRMGPHLGDAGGGLSPFHAGATPDFARTRVLHRAEMDFTAKILHALSFEQL